MSAPDYGAVEADQAQAVVAANRADSYISDKCSADEGG